MLLTNLKDNQLFQFGEIRICHAKTEVHVLGFVIGACSQYQHVPLQLANSDRYTVINRCIILLKLRYLHQFLFVNLFFSFSRSYGIIGCMLHQWNQTNGLNKMVKLMVFFNFCSFFNLNKIVKLTSKSIYSRKINGLKVSSIQFLYHFHFHFFFIFTFSIYSNQINPIFLFSQCIKSVESIHNRPSRFFFFCIFLYFAVLSD